MVAGEVSGDIHAGNLLNELRQLQPQIQAFGVGGERLAAAGLECLAHSHELAHMGLAEVVRELPRIRRILHRLVDTAAQRRPRLAVLVDSPDFNLRLAARLRRLGVPVVLFISPQLWAWRQGRVRQVARLAEEVLCILPFEVPFYDGHSTRARYVGHPLVDDVARAGLGVSQEVIPGRVAMLPGSRASEVRKLLPAMIRAVDELPATVLGEAMLIEAPGVTAAIDEVLAVHSGDRRIKRVRGEQRRSVLASCQAAWTASGTATLECALLGVPMAVGYRLNPLTWVLAHLLVRVPHVALVNLIADARIAPELLQGQWCPSRLAVVMRDLLAEAGEEQRLALAEVRRRLGEPGASRRAAEAISGHLETRGDHLETRGETS